MSPDSIPQLSLGTAALIIFVVCAGFVMLRGMTRMLIGTVVLALSAWFGFLVWQEAPTLSVDWFGKSIGLVTTGLPIVTFLISFLLIRIIAKSIARPFGKSEDDEEKSGSPIIRLAFRLLLALIPTTLICLVGATFIHHSGSVAEVRSASDDPDHSPSTGFIQQLKSSIDSVLPASWLAALDPLTDPSRVALAKAIAAGSHLEPAIDPSTGTVIPRAIIVEDPELQKLAREGNFSALLRHPALTKALQDPKIQSLLKNLHL